MGKIDYNNKAGLEPGTLWNQIYLTIAEGLVFPCTLKLKEREKEKNRGRERKGKIDYNSETRLESGTLWNQIYLTIGRPVIYFYAMPE